MQTVHASRCLFLRVMGACVFVCMRVYVCVCECAWEYAYMFNYTRNENRSHGTKMNCVYHYTALMILLLINVSMGACDDVGKDCHEDIMCEHSGLF